MYNTGLVSGDSVVHIYTCSFLHSFHYGLLQYIEYCSLCYTVGPSCLFIFVNLLINLLIYYCINFYWHVVAL